MSYRTAIFSGTEGFEVVREHWEVLRPYARHYNQLPEWVENLAPGAFCWLLVTDDDRPVAAAALGLRKVGFLAKNVRVLTGVRQRLDGTEGHGLPLGTFAFADPAADSRAIAASLLAGYRQSGAKWDVLWLSMLREGSVWLSADYGSIAPDLGSPVLDTTMPSPQFWTAASANLKHGLAKARRRLEREHRRSDIVEAKTPEQVGAAFDAFVSLEAKGWKRDVGAFAKRPERAGFLRRFLVTAAGKGIVTVRSLLIDDVVTACQIAVQVQDTLFLMRITYDEELQHLSPGNILLADLISISCDDSTIARIDCGQWAAWHDRWGMTTVPRYRLVAFNGRSATGLAARAAWKGLGVVGKRPSNLQAGEGPRVSLRRTKGL